MFQQHKGYICNRLHHQNSPVVGDSDLSLRLNFLMILDLTFSILSINATRQPTFDFANPSLFSSPLVSKSETAIC